MHGQKKACDVIHSRILNTGENVQNEKYISIQQAELLKLCTSIVM